MNLIYQTTVGCLQKRDNKGVGNQYVDEDKLIIFDTHTPMKALIFKERGGCAGGGKGYLGCEELAFTLSTSSDRNVMHEIDTTTKNKNQTTGCHGEVVLCGFDSLSSNSMKSSNPHSGVHVDAITKTLDTNYPCPSKNQGGNCVVHVKTKRVRRLTPKEFARLQGFPDDWAAIDGASDAQQYSVYGNSMTVNVMRWLGSRIKAVYDILEEIEIES